MDKRDAGEIRIGASGTLWNDTGRSQDCLSLLKTYALILTAHAESRRNSNSRFRVGATGTVGESRIVNRVSIHAPVGERLADGVHGALRERVSIHAPTGVAMPGGGGVPGGDAVLIHAPV